MIFKATLLVTFIFQNSWCSNEYLQCFYVKYSCYYTITHYGLFILSFSFTYIYSHIHIVRLFLSIRRGHSPFLHCLLLRGKKPPWGAEPRFQLRPAIHQASELPTELRCTLRATLHAKLRCTLTMIYTGITSIWFSSMSFSNVLVAAVSLWFSFSSYHAICTKHVVAFH